MDTALMVSFMFSLKFSHFFDLGLSTDKASFLLSNQLRCFVNLNLAFNFFFFSCILFCYTFNQLLGNYLKLNAQIRLINSSV